jgi:hypothetical protein
MLFPHPHDVRVCVANSKKNNLAFWEFGVHLRHSITSSTLHGARPVTIIPQKIDPRICYTISPD